MSSNITLDASDIGLYYANGDKLQTIGYYVANGYLTAGGKEISFIINTPKLLTNVTSITVNHLSCVFRGVSGYVNGTSAIDYATASGYTVTANKTTDNAIMIMIIADTAYTSGTNNTPIAIAGASAG